MIINNIFANDNIFTNEFDYKSTFTWNEFNSQVFENTLSTRQLWVIVIFYEHYKIDEKYQRIEILQINEWVILIKNIKLLINFVFD